MSNYRTRETIRVIEMARDYDLSDAGIEPIDIDENQLQSVIDILERIYAPGEPTYELPIVKHVPRVFNETSLTTISGGTIPVYVTPDREEIILLELTTNKLVKYKLYKKMNVDDKPIFDTYRLTRIREGEWYYYMPAGDEFNAFMNNQDIITSTHYLINWENNTIIDYPYGSAVGPGDDVMFHKNKLRTILLASLVDPKLFRESSKKYFAGTIQESDVAKILETATNTIMAGAEYRAREKRMMNIAAGVTAGVTGSILLTAMLYSMFFVADP